MKQDEVHVAAPRHQAVADRARRSATVSEGAANCTVAIQRLADHQLAIDESPRMWEQSRSLAGAFGNAISLPANRTGMPDQLKAGIENLSGMDMTDVRVHRNSAAPAQLGAFAYAQGNDIHLGPGQEQHLPHEAWHVVQQRQGRVRATTQIAQVGVNDDAALEAEADAMGMQAAQMKAPAAVSLKQLQTISGTAQLGRKKELGSGKRFIKLVLPGSGDLHWRTRTHQERQKMAPLHEESSEQQAWRRVVSGGTVELTIAGPQNLYGASDTGPNRIENNISLGIKLIAEQVKEENGKWPTANIVILIKAHSRNAVAATQISRELALHFFRTYGFDDSPTVEVVMLDPVPGPLHSGELVQTNVDIIPRSTLVYSLHTQYIAGFAPQKVTGAQRLIISMQDHGTGTTSSFQHAAVIYKGSNLNSLPAGVFVGVHMDTQNNVERIRQIFSKAELIQFLQQVGPTTQAARLAIIDEVASTYRLIDNSAAATKEKVD